MTRKLLYTDGSATIEMPDEIGAMVERAVRNAAPAAVAILEREMQDIYQAAHREWPVGDRYTKDGRQWRKGGTSKAALEWGIRVRGDSIEGFVRNTAPYAWYIKGLAQNGKSTWQELVRKPGLARSERVALDIAEALAAVSRGDK